MIASRAGVSSATVCRVLTGHPGVNEATRRRVQAAIDELGYVPDPALGRFFKTINGGIRGVAFSLNASTYRLIAAGNDPFYSRMSAAVQSELSKRGRHVISVNSETDSLPDGTLNCVAQGLCNGVVGRLRDIEQTACLARQVPVVLLNSEYDVPLVDVVIPDVERAAQRQLAYLVERGHRAIACFRPRPGAGQWGVGTWQDRRFWHAYRAYCEDRGLILPDEYLAPIEFGPESEREAVAAFLERLFSLAERSPTAILTYDGYAGELIRQLATRGLRVPQEVSIFGYDDYHFGHPCPLGLSTFRQDFAAMAEHAVRLLLERMENPKRPAVRVAVDGAIIERESTAVAPPGGGPGA